VAQEGFPPRRSSRLSDSDQPPVSGRPDRPGRHSAPAAPAEPGWQSGRAPVREDPYAGIAEPVDRPRGGERPQRPGERHPRGSRDDWRQQDPFAQGDDEGEVPPWAGMSIHATRAGGSRLAPPEATGQPQPDGPGGPGAPGPRRGRGRAAAARLRRSQRRVYLLCGTAIVVAVVVALVVALLGLHHKPAQQDSFIKTLQPGEFTAAPSACKAVSPSLLSQYLPGPTRKVNPELTGNSDSQCTFTVDHPPVFRVLLITVQAYQPSLISAGNGSASSNAFDSFITARQALLTPPKKSPLSKARLANVSGLGQDALTAVQFFRSGRVRDALVTLIARERNVILTVSLQSQARGGAVATLRSGVLAVGREVMAKAEAEPTVKR
jgi:hypothetical protein